VRWHTDALSTDVQTSPNGDFFLRQPLNEAYPMQATLRRLAEDGAGPGQIADTAVTMWRGVDAALSPIIGRRGVAALYKRSLYLTRDDYPWLAGVHQATVREGEFAPLHTLLSQQTSTTAAAANIALLQMFFDLLTRLIGAQLAERLLPSMRDTPNSGNAAQDNSP
jgi:hypothetical protein